MTSPDSPTVSPVMAYTGPTQSGHSLAVRLFKKNVELSHGCHLGLL
jgi:hypothetical protein